MSETLVNKPKKSVALSGVTAGNTALCTVGRTGNDLHYRGYDILEIAETCEFEEIAHLLVHGTLPTAAQLSAYKARLHAMRGIPASVKTVLEALPPATHPMDVMRTAVSALGCALPERDDHNQPGAKDIADRLMACLGSMLLYWFHYAQNGKRIDVETDDDSIGGHFMHLLHGTAPSAEWVRAMHTSLNLYAEHEFNASTFACRVVAGTGSDMFSAITAGIGALRGPKHGGANEVALEVQQRYATPDEAEADIRRRVAAKEVVIGFGHPVYTVSDPRNEVIKAVARRLSEKAGNMGMLKGYAFLGLAPIRAAGDTRFSMIVGVVASAAVIPLAWYGIDVLRLGLYSVPFAWICGWLFWCALVYARMRGFDWAAGRINDTCAQSP